MKKYIPMLCLFALGAFCKAQETGTFKGTVTNEKGDPVDNVTVHIRNIRKGTLTDSSGNFVLKNIPYGEYTVKFSHLSFDSKETAFTISSSEPVVETNVTLIAKMETLDDIEVFGEKERAQKGLNMITRMPLRPSEQIQTISIISSKVIEAQGALTITDVAKNSPGVILFASYGGGRESMSIRGFRGVPVLKNGVRLDSQLQTASGVTDMQGVESLQVIKGSAAITQGVITDLGNAGGVINLVTKTPDFKEEGSVGIRGGSWGQARGVFDYQTVLDKRGTVAVRIDGAFERTDSYRKIVQGNKVYINPSITWRPNRKTTITVEGDYLNQNSTPVTSAVNLAADQGTNALYVLPYNKFLGFNVENNNTVLSTMMAHFDRKLSDKISLRAAFAMSAYKRDLLSSTTAPVSRSADYHLRNRSLSKSLRDDKNSVFQVDVIGQDLYTGKVKHTAQLGLDYRISDASTTGFALVKPGASGGGATGGRGANSVVDQINIYEDFTNEIPSNSGITFSPQTPVLAYYSTYGILAQDVVEVNRYLKAFLGVRYSEIQTKNQTGVSGIYRRSAWNPSLGLMVTPIKQINVFGSYTNSTSLRSASQRTNDEREVGPSNTEQYEAGIKSDWLDNKLRFNFTYFYIYTGNLANAEYVPGTNQTTGYVFKAGDLVRKGIETELNGRISDNLTVMLGYAYLDAYYTKTPAYEEGSAPMNAPKHTGNSWIQYVFDRGLFKGLSLSAGVYYVGERPVNEYSLTPQPRYGILEGIKPFNMPAYTTLNAQIGYGYKNAEIRLYLNNLTNEVGLNSYFRGGFINQIDPRNFSLSLLYRF